MADSNKSRKDSTVRFARNKAAFEEVLGNPFVKPEPLQGHYQRFKTKSVIKSTVYSDETAATRNNCQPTVLDFFCDVERIVGKVMVTKDRIDLFWRTYVTDEDDRLFTPQEREEIEQQVGSSLLELKLSPVLGYFKTERKPGMMTRK